jgi:hypothetical protein
MAWSCLARNAFVWDAGRRSAGRPRQFVAQQDAISATEMQNAGSGRNPPVGHRAKPWVKIITAAGFQTGHEDPRIMEPEQNKATVRNYGLLVRAQRHSQRCKTGISRAEQTPVAPIFSAPPDSLHLQWQGAVVTQFHKVRRNRHKAWFNRRREKTLARPFCQKRGQARYF